MAKACMTLGRSYLLLFTMSENDFYCIIDDVICGEDEELVCKLIRGLGAVSGGGLDFITMGCFRIYLSCLTLHDSFISLVLA